MQEENTIIIMHVSISCSRILGKGIEAKLYTVFLSEELKVQNWKCDQNNICDVVTSYWSLLKLFSMLYAEAVLEKDCSK